jgi:hypothetical protein
MLPAGCCPQAVAARTAANTAHAAVRQDQWRTLSSGISTIPAILGSTRGAWVRAGNHLYYLVPA